MTEIEAGRAAMPDRDAEISQEAARAMLAALRPFADAAKELDSWHRDRSHIWETAAAMAIEAGHLRAARAAIALAERGA